MIGRPVSTNQGARNWRLWLMRELGIPVRRGRPRKVRHV